MKHSNIIIYLALFIAIFVPLRVHANANGSIIVDPDNPAWLIYENGSPFFMCGPGDPEGFLYLGSRNSDGTRNGDQLSIIESLKSTGANSIYLIATRSHGGDGDSDENPFINSDASNQLDDDILNQWESWFTEMDNNGIVIYFFFYDDNIKVSSALGWDLDSNGNLHSQENYYITTLVNRFKHHNNLIWVVMEEVEEMGSDYIEHASKIAELTRQTDENNHVISAHQLAGLVFNFPDDPNIDQFAIQYKNNDPSDLHNAMLEAWNNANGRYNLNMAEIPSKGIGTGDAARQRIWAIAMGGAYIMAQGWDISSTPVERLNECGYMVDFFSSTTINKMSPNDDLAYGGTEYVLADPGNSYVAYASSLNGNLGLKSIQQGLYDFTWLDVVTGAKVDQQNISLSDGDQEWSKPDGIGNELAVYIRKSDSTTTTSDPELDIQANSSDGPLYISQNDSLSISISIASGGNSSNADWWLLAKTSSGWYSYNANSESWQYGIFAAYQGYLFDFNSYNIFNFTGLPPDAYILYFGIDLTVDGNIDASGSQLYYNSVEVTVQ